MKNKLSYYNVLFLLGLVSSTSVQADQCPADEVEACKDMGPHWCNTYFQITDGIGRRCEVGGKENLECKASTNTCEHYDEDRLRVIENARAIFIAKAKADKEAAKTKEERHTEAEQARKARLDREMKSIGFSPLTTYPSTFGR